MNEALRRFSSIGRPVDRRYPTNRAIASLTLVVAILGFAIRRLTGTHPLESFLGGITLAIGFFLACAIARELDPDHDFSSFVAAGAFSLLAAAPSRTLPTSHGLVAKGREPRPQRRS